jgi:ABC-type arginine transport system permease subunit
VLRDSIKSGLGHEDGLAHVVEISHDIVGAIHAAYNPRTVHNAVMAVEGVSESAAATGLLRRLGSMRIMLKSAMNLGGGG